MDLNKRAEKVGIILTKKKINNVPCQVKLGIDKSGSMDWLYQNGTVQNIVERILAISMNVDMDKTLDIWGFHSHTKALKPVTVPITENYVDKEIVAKMGWGGTSYAPCMEAILESSKGKKGLFGFGKKDADPTLAIFITDGENDDENESERIIKNSQGNNIYWMLIGIGKSGNFRFIERLGEKYPNCGFVGIRDIETVDDDDMFDAIFNDELVEWFSKFKK